MLCLLTRKRRQSDKNVETALTFCSVFFGWMKSTHPENAQTEEIPFLCTARTFLPGNHLFIQIFMLSIAIIIIIILFAAIVVVVVVINVRDGGKTFLAATT